MSFVERFSASSLPSLSSLTLPLILSPSSPVPSGLVQDLRVRRSADAKTLLAEWKAPDTTPPEGEVARYLVQYRDSDKGEVMEVGRIGRVLVVNNVVDADNYEVMI